LLVNDAGEFKLFSDSLPGDFESDLLGI
jgi:hypothetical protein